MWDDARVSMGLAFSRAGMRALDAHAIGEAGVPSLVLMEHAAAAVVRAAERSLAEVGGGLVAAVCGAGNNGGDGLAACRLLLSRGVACRAVLAMDASAYTGDAGAQLAAARGVGVAVAAWDGGGVLDDAAVVIDGVFGTGLSRPIEGAVAGVIERINLWRDQPGERRVVAIDVPSGVDADTGEPLGDGPCVRADGTVTLGGMKSGLRAPGAQRYTGDVEVGELGLPRGMLERFAEGGGAS